MQRPDEGGDGDGDNQPEGDRDVEAYAKISVIRKTDQAQEP